MNVLFFICEKKKRSKKLVILINMKFLLFNFNDVFDRIYVVYGEYVLLVGCVMFLLIIVVGEVLMEGLFVINFDWRIISFYV